jgi:signal transduction histidine kinase
MHAQIAYTPAESSNEKRFLVSLAQQVNKLQITSRWGMRQPMTQTSRLADLAENDPRPSWRRPPLHRKVPVAVRPAVVPLPTATANEIIALASHELRTPLTSIKSWTEMARNKLAQRGSDDVGRYLASVSRQVARMEAVITTFLDEPVVVASPVGLEGSVFDLRQLAADLVSDLPQEWGTRMRVARATPLLVEADRGRVEQVLSNLLTNAIKYSQPRSCIRLSLFRSGPLAVVFIADRGQGIPAAQLPHIFDRYFRVPGSRSAGLGLGLHVVKHIVEQQGGTVAVRSREGYGSIFRFSLPHGLSPSEDGRTKHAAETS